jgi:hypothetical protein
VQTFLGIAIFAVGTAAWVVGFWAWTEAMKKARDAGYRYWAINPLATLHAIRTKEFLIFLVAGAVMTATALAGIHFFGKGPL